MTSERLIPGSNVPIGDKFAVPHRVAVILLLLTLPATAQAEEFTFMTNSGAIIITRYSGTNADVTIPDTITGLPVTSIGTFAFSSNTSLTSVTIPTSITNINDKAFSSCISLAAITVDPLNAFYASVDGALFNKTTNTLIQCPGGKAGSYVIPDSVTTIGSGAFQYCSSLSNLTIPNSVTSIGRAAFYACEDLTSVLTLK